MTALGKMAKGLQTFASDVAQGFFEITHNGFAVVGLAQVGSGKQGEHGEDDRQAHDGKAVVRDFEEALGDVGRERLKPLGHLS